MNPKKPRSAWPRLKGKGGEIKNILPAIIELFRARRRSGEHQVHDNRVIRILESFQGIVDIIDEGKYDAMLAIPEVNKLKAYVDQALDDWTW